MDRNTTLGLALIAGIVLTWMIFFGPSNETPPIDKTAQAQLDSTQIKEAEAAQKAAFAEVEKDGVAADMPDSVFNALSDSAKQAVLLAKNAQKYGVFAPLRTGTDRKLRVETDRFMLDLHSRGAFIGAFFLKGYKTYDSLPLPIQLDDAANRFSLNFQQNGDVQFPGVETQDLYFEPQYKDSVLKLTGGAKQELVFSANVSATRKLEFVYTFYGDKFDYDLEIRQTGMDAVIKSSDVQATWSTFIPKTESSILKMREKAAIYYRESGSVDWINPTGGNDVVEKKATGVDWVSFHSQFFAHTLLSDKESTHLSGLEMAQNDPPGVNPEDPNTARDAKAMQVRFGLSLAKSASDSQKFKFYAGPLDFAVLKTYDRDMTRQIELGWGPLKWINRWFVIPLFGLLEGWNLNYGLIIFLLALIIKIILYPLTYRTQISTTRMRLVNSMPEVKALDEKFKDNPTKLQQEKMGIYRQYGVSLLGGCWPMLLSYPFLIAFFFFFPNAIELRQQSFLWAHDLSTYDSILDFGFSVPWYGDHVSLFTLLMTISIYAFTFISQANQAQMNTNPVLKYMPYVMPLIFLGLLNNYSAGLSWYYLVSNVISIAQTLITKRFINEPAMVETMREAAKAKKGEGKGKNRLERWAETQQARQREQQRQRSSGPKGKGTK
jgi:YidC/Oxa1 family membrane protein insertase